MHQERFGRLFDARRFRQMILDERNTVLLNVQSVRRVIDTDAWDRF